MRDLHNNIAPKRGISPAAAVTDNTAFVSQILDMAGYEAAEFIVLTGSIADADTTIACLVEHGDVSNLSDAAAVPDAQLLGLETQAGPIFSDDDKVFKIGYIGNKRYVRVTFTPAANTGNIFLAGVWIGGGARNKPTSNPPS